MIGKSAVALGGFSSFAMFLYLLFKTKDKLFATITTSEYKFPFTIDESLNSQYQQLTKNLIKERISNSVEDESQLQSITEDISEMIGIYYPMKLSRLLDYRNYFYILKATIQNGKTTCENVTLDLPGCFVAEVTKPGCETQNIWCNSQIIIGTMRPTEKVQITGWGTREGGTNEFTLTHNKGVGTIRFRKLADQFWADLPKNFSSYFSIVIMLSSIFVIGFLILKTIISK